MFLSVGDLGGEGVLKETFCFCNATSLLSFLEKGKVSAYAQLNVLIGHLTMSKLSKTPNILMTD